MQSAAGYGAPAATTPSTVSPSSTSTSGSGVFASRSRSEARRRMHAARRRFASVLPKLRPTTTMSCVAASPGTKTTVTSRAIQPSDGPGASTLRYRSRASRSFRRVPCGSFARMRPRGDAFSRSRASRGVTKTSEPAGSIGTSPCATAQESANPSESRMARAKRGTKIRANSFMAFSFCGWGLSCSCSSWRRPTRRRTREAERAAAGRRRRA